MCRTGAGVTAAFSTTTAGIGTVTEISGWSEFREAINCPVALSAAAGTYQTKEPGHIMDTDPMTLTIEFDPDDATLAAAMPPAAETLTVTWPTVGAQTSGATLVGTGFFTRRSMESLTQNEATLGSYEWTWDNKTAPDFTVGS